jgi:Cu(I)-responsive transcriptional regulator
MNIGEAAAATGIPAKTLRYYEEIGLVTPLRGANGYRRYRPSDVQKLGLVARARALGFSIEHCRALLALWTDRSRASADVKRIAQGHLREIADKIAALQSMQDVLERLVASCAGDDRPACPILEGLALPETPR